MASCGLLGSRSTRVTTTSRAPTGGDYDLYLCGDSYLWHRAYVRKGEMIGFDLQKDGQMFAVAGEERYAIPPGEWHWIHRWSNVSFDLRDPKLLEATAIVTLCVGLPLFVYFSNATATGPIRIDPH